MCSQLAEELGVERHKLTGLLRAMESSARS